MRKAGSEAKDKYLSKMAYEIENREHVVAYMAALRDIRSEESDIELQELVAYTRKCIEMAMDNGKPKDAEGHIRLLAELGGHIKNNVGAGGSKVEVNNYTKPASNFRSEKLEEDFDRLKAIVNLNDGESLSIEE